MIGATAAYVNAYWHVLVTRMPPLSRVQFLTRAEAVQSTPLRLEDVADAHACACQRRPSEASVHGHERIQIIQSHCQRFLQRLQLLLAREPRILRFLVAPPTLLGNKLRFDLVVVLPTPTPSTSTKPTAPSVAS
jgi:hypothetical protein